MTDKNLVITESQFHIEFEENKNHESMPCPRCGHLQERSGSSRTICASCKHNIPNESTRQNWTSRYSNTYVQDFVEPASIAAKRAVAFKAARGGFEWQCQLRRAVVITSAVALVVYGSAYALKTYVGEKQFKVIATQVQQHLPMSIASK